jgi:4-amino-4-deoxy-L-arabinose transferase-like glycosyltransferase
MTVSSIQNPKSKTRNALWWMVGILLLAAAFRFLAVDSAPPGWRDDELIEFNMDRRIADGWRPLFITEAEGHEPVYHYLHAGTITLFGDNIVGYKWLPFACGLLTIALTYALAKKMFGENP